MSFARTKNSKITGNYEGVYSCDIIKACSGQAIEGKKFFARFQHNRLIYKSLHFDSEKEAALWYDKKKIELGLQPVNILKPKSSPIQ